jgi:hypothetical protein
MQIAGAKRKLTALALLAAIAALAWTTLDPGKIRLVVMILLGGFAIRIALTAKPPAHDGTVEAEERR